MTDQQAKEGVTWKFSRCGLTVISAVRMKPTPTATSMQLKCVFPKAQWSWRLSPKVWDGKKKGNSLGVLETGREDTDPKWLSPGTREITMVAEFCLSRSRHTPW